MLDHNKIYFGDCLEVMSDIDDNSIDLILTDLPFGTTKCKWDIIIPFDQLWTQYERIIKDNGAILLFGIEPFSSHLRLSNIKIYRYDWYWNKKRAANFLFMNKMPGKIIETISVFYKKQPKYFPQKRPNPLGTSTRHLHKNPSKISNHLVEMVGQDNYPLDSTTQNFSGKNYEPDKLLPNSLVEYVKDTKRLHPTQKPIGLCEYLIKTYTEENDLILDSCCGSGTTGVAAHNLNRQWIMIENNQQYFDVATKRMENLTQ